jgi:hypothetical protein
VTCGRKKRRRRKPVRRADASRNVTGEQFVDRHCRL